MSSAIDYLPPPLHLETNQCLLRGKRVACILPALAAIAGIVALLGFLRVGGGLNTLSCTTLGVMVGVSGLLAIISCVVFRYLSFQEEGVVRASRQKTLQELYCMSECATITQADVEKMESILDNDPAVLVLLCNQEDKATGLHFLFDCAEFAPLWTKVGRGTDSASKKVLENGMRQKDASNFTPLHIAALETTRYSLTSLRVVFKQWHTLLGIQDDQGDTPLHNAFGMFNDEKHKNATALTEGEKAFLNELLVYGAPYINIQNNAKKTAIDIIANKNLQKLVALALKKEPVTV